MRSRSSFTRINVWCLLRYTSLGLILIAVSACHRGANLIPYGYEDVFHHDPERSSTAARVDYPIVVTDPSKYTTFRVTKHGVRTWFWDFEKFFIVDQQSWWDWSPTWYRIILTMDGREKPICITEWKARTEEPQEVPCDFTVNAYLSKPLLAMLFYKMGGDEKNPPADKDLTIGVLPRYYYLIPKP